MAHLHLIWLLLVIAAIVAGVGTAVMLTAPKDTPTFRRAIEAPMPEPWHSATRVEWSGPRSQR